MISSAGVRCTERPVYLIVFLGSTARTLLPLSENHFFSFSAAHTEHQSTTLNYTCPGALLQTQ